MKPFFISIHVPIGSHPFGSFSHLPVFRFDCWFMQNAINRANQFLSHLPKGSGYRIWCEDICGGPDYSTESKGVPS